MNRITPVVKNLLIINVLLFLATYVFGSLNLTRYLALFYPGSPSFQPYQFVTYMFMHGGFTHILFNMYALWLFGTAIESSWGGKRFFIYYFFTGIGAALLHVFVNFLTLDAIISIFNNSPSVGLFNFFVKMHGNYFNQNVYEFIEQWKASPDNPIFAAKASKEMQWVYERAINIPTVGASGAVFGILLAFGMMYPDARLMLLIPPIPIKAKWFVIGYGVLELILAFSRPGSNIAHFAHLGGMLFGYLLIKYWIAQAKR